MKCCPSLLDTTNLRVPSRNLRDYSIFSFCCPPTNCLLFNAHQLRIWFVEAAICLENGMLPSIRFYTCNCIPYKIVGAQ
jgi:hypothetical protein